MLQVRYIALAMVEVTFLPFYEHRFFELHLVLGSCGVQDLKATRCTECSTSLDGGLCVLGLPKMHKPRAPNSTPPFRPIVPSIRAYNYS